MSMRNCVINNNCFLICRKNFDKFMSYYKGKENFEEMNIYEIGDYLPLFYTNITGDFSGITDMAKNVYFDEEPISYYTLKKDESLYDCYKSIEEIIDEVISFFECYDFELPKDFVKKWIGEIKGTCFG